MAGVLGEEKLLAFDVRGAACAKDSSPAAENLPPRSLKKAPLLVCFGRPGSRDERVDSSNTREGGVHSVFSYTRGDGKEGTVAGREDIDSSIFTYAN